MSVILVLQETLRLPLGDTSSLFRNLINPCYHDCVLPLHSEIDQAATIPTDPAARTGAVSST